MQQINFVKLIQKRKSRIRGTAQLSESELLHAFDYLGIFAHYVRIAFSAVRQKAVTAVLKPRISIFKIAAAVITQGIQRTVAEKTVKILRMRCFMTREELTLCM